ncbi:putative RNA-directed DNA polymerase from transposon BS [Trichonephila clavata]|uniref:Putative RNA-directed DNA polymerase from transposon BS n=1 Tax=Trichonephila clavata TaxID=2740835 RepID=A0A8X6H3N3_TRICU|nr:putative RNA-directed DNA polymerase from transposon BS [Trichonephila clavata]
MTDETDNADRAVDKFTEIILACAVSCIPRGQRKKFSPFWNKELQTLKENRDKAVIGLNLLVSKDLLGCPPVCLNQELEDIFNSPFSHWELEWGIKQFPQRKSVGLDGILPEFLAHLGNEAKRVLLKLINLTWASGIPNMWRKGEIIPILKDCKNPAHLASFRPITLTCVMCKLTEHLIQVLTLSTKPKAIQLFYGDYQLQRTQEATYLGIVLDSRLSWNKQASRVQAVGKTRNELLKRLSGVKWGTTQDLLCTTYKSYIRPAIQYGSELLVTASEAVQNKIETVQNNALRIITGGAFSTPIQTMQIQANVEPLTFGGKWELLS